MDAPTHAAQLAPRADSLDAGRRLPGPRHSHGAELCSLGGLRRYLLSDSRLCTVRGEDDDPETERLRQRTLLMLVPKLIVDGAASMGWSVTEGPSAFYGGGGDAPMATWVLDFALTAKAGASARIAASLASVGRAAISIDKDGSKVTLP